MLTLLSLTPMLSLAQNHVPFSPSAANIEQFQQGTQAGRVEEAAADFRQLTETAPRFAEAYLNLGLALNRLGRDDEAVHALEKGIATKPSMCGAHLFLAISQYRLNHLEPAAAAIHTETSHFAGDAQAWMWQGIIELALERTPCCGSIGQSRRARSHQYRHLVPSGSRRA